LQENISSFSVPQSEHFIRANPHLGLPRDRNTRAACAIYDSKVKKVRFFRLEYNIEEAQEKILKAKLPPALAERLSLGI